MKYTAFYSWQSDLPNRDNRSFIETCVKKAIKTLEKDMDIRLFIDYDRDTKGLPGSPDIAEEIFLKIQKTDIFVCDVSIINPECVCSRKTPNPNVLLELGYAAKVLGWDKVICICNTKYGTISDLPFDLDHKRILQYNSDSKDAKKNVTDAVINAITLIWSKGLLYNPLKDYLKGKIDYCFLEIIKQIACLSLGTISMSDALVHVKALLGMNYAEFRECFSVDKTVLGFFARNDLAHIQPILDAQFSAITSSAMFPMEWASMILHIIDWLRSYQWYISERATKKLYRYVLSPVNYLAATRGMETDNRNTDNLVLLTERVGKSVGKVLYSASIPRIKSNILLSPHKMKDVAIDDFVKMLYRILEYANTWLDMTGSEFILDPDYYEIS